MDMTYPTPASTPNLSQSTVSSPILITSSSSSSSSSSMERNASNDTPGSSASNSPQVPHLTLVRALYDYTSQVNSGLSFKQGQIIHVINQLDSGWWDGICNGQRGWFPMNFVQELSASSASDDIEKTLYYI